MDACFENFQNLHCQKKHSKFSIPPLAQTRRDQLGPCYGPGWNWMMVAFFGSSLYCGCFSVGGRVLGFHLRKLPLVLCRGTLPKQSFPSLRSFLGFSPLFVHASYFLLLFVYMDLSLAFCKLSHCKILSLIHICILSFKKKKKIKFSHLEHLKG